MADDGLDMNSLIPGPAYKAGNSYIGMKINYGYTGTNIDPANIPLMTDVPETVGRKAGLLLQHSQTASPFGVINVANNPLPTAAPTAEQTAQMIQPQLGSFGLLVRADGAEQRTQGLNPRVQGWVGKEKTAVAADTLRVLGPDVSPDTAAQVINTVTAEAEMQSAPAMPKLFRPNVG